MWSSGRDNFEWQEMAGGHPSQCYHSPNDWNLEICRDRIASDLNGDVAVLWKPRQGGTYRFEWDSDALKFYRHLNYVGSQEPGSELAHSAVIEDVVAWEMFFWVAQKDTNFHILIHRLPE